MDGPRPRYMPWEAELARGRRTRSALEEILGGVERARTCDEESATDNELMWRQLR